MTGLPQALAAADAAGRRARWLTLALIVLGGLLFLGINAWYVVMTHQSDRRQEELLRITREENTRMDAFIVEWTEERARQAVEARERLTRIEAKVDALVSRR